MTPELIPGAVYQERGDRRYKIRVLEAAPNSTDPNDPAECWEVLDLTSGVRYTASTKYLTDNYELEQA